MVKIVFCLRRRAGLSVQEFQDYWLTRHAPLVKERARALGIKRYIQSHTILDPRLNGLAEQRGFAGEPYDGVAELWFESATALHPNDNAPAASLQAAKELLADEGAFIDLPSSPIFVVQEHEILAAKGAAQAS